MKILSTRETWVVALTDAEIVSVTAKLLHCQNNGINATTEEKLKAVNYFEDRLLKDEILDKEIANVRAYKDLIRKDNNGNER